VHRSHVLFVQLCKLLTTRIEACEHKNIKTNKPETIDWLMNQLNSKGVVFDRALADRLFDRLVNDTSLDSNSIEDLRRKVQQKDYLDQKMLESLGDKILMQLNGNYVE